MQELNLVHQKFSSLANMRPPIGNPSVLDYVGSVKDFQDAIKHK